MTSRHNLVICCAGDTSRHVQYLDDSRNYDVCVIYYGDRENRYREGCEHYHALKGTKYQLLYRVLSENLHLLNRYRQFWLPDDDLETDTASVNRMFDLFDREDLYIAQPSLTSDSVASFTELVNKGMGTCETNFVEVMCPLFSTQSLLHALPFFTETLSGWGVDLLWSSLARQRNQKIGVLDQIAVGHYRPLGSSDWYQSLGVDPHRELDDLKRRYGLDVVQNVYRIQGEDTAPSPVQGHGGFAARHSIKLPPPRDYRPGYLQAISPVIIGGQGGSCTRAVAELLLRTNRIYLDLDIDEWDGTSLDAWCMRTQDRSAGLNAPELIGSLIGSTRSPDYSLDDLPAGLCRELLSRSKTLDVLLKERFVKRRAFIQIMQALGEDYCDIQYWGWKEPRSMYYLPLWQAMYGRFSFIHVVRDVRTIRQKHLEGQADFYQACFGRHEANPQTAFEELWAAINLGAYRWATRHIPRDYFILQVEKLAGQRETAQREINRLVNFLGINFTDKDKLARVFRPLRQVPRTPRTGRVAEALQVFGYQPDA
jgi:hypothetical protein